VKIAGWTRRCFHDALIAKQAVSQVIGQPVHLTDTWMSTFVLPIEKGTCK
jgi:hypothetical protein